MRVQLTNAQRLSQLKRVSREGFGMGMLRFTRRYLVDIHDLIRVLRILPKLVEECVDVHVCVSAWAAYCSVTNGSLVLGTRRFYRRDV